MARIMGAFPYNEDEVPAPVTDGTLASVPTGRDITIDGPQQPRQKAKNRGAIIPGTIGNTDLVDCNLISYAIFAGDF